VSVTVAFTVTPMFDCEHCGQTVTLETEGQYELLHVSCGCKGRYIKVKDALPERWHE